MSEVTPPLDRIVDVEPPPWRAGMDAAKANAVPGAVLSLFAAGLLLSYWYVGPIHAGLAWLGEWKLRAGLPFAMVSTAMFGGGDPVDSATDPAEYARGNVVVGRTFSWFVLRWTTFSGHRRELR